MEEEPPLLHDIEEAEVIPTDNKKLMRQLKKTDWILQSYRNGSLQHSQ
jgi:hypothetical protein